MLVLNHRNFNQVRTTENLFILFSSNWRQDDHLYNQMFDIGFFRLNLSHEIQNAHPFFLRSDAAKPNSRFYSLVSLTSLSSTVLKFKFIWRRSCLLEAVVVCPFSPDGNKNSAFMLVFCFLKLVQTWFHRNGCNVVSRFPPWGRGPSGQIPPGSSMFL